MSETMSETAIQPGFEWWARALAGEKMTYHESDCHFGYYRMKRRDGNGWQTVGIYPNAEGGHQVFIDGKLEPEERHTQIFQFACENPISYELYCAVAFDGEPWPDMPPEMGHNLPEGEEVGPELAQHRQQLEDETAAIAKFLKEPIATQERADQAANWAGRIAKLKAWFKARYDEINAPLLRRQNEIRADYLHPSQEADGLAKRLTDAQTKYLAAEQRKRDEAAQKARQAAEEARLREIEAARKAGDEEAVAQAEAAPLPLVEPEKVTTGGGTGRKTGLSFDIVPQVNDYLALATALIRGEDGKAAPGECLNADLKAALDTVAKKETRGKAFGETFPGGVMVRKARARR